MPVNPMSDHPATPLSSSLPDAKPNLDASIKEAVEMPLTALSQPFDNTRNTAFFYASSGHAEAISRLQYLVEDANMGLGLLTGEIGCGKTITRTVLQKNLEANERTTVVSLENCILGFDDLLLEIVSQMRRERLGSTDLADRYSRLVAFKQVLMRRVVDHDRHLVILLDEAQQLALADLESIKALTNIAAEKRNFVTVLLIGQPELRNHVRAVPAVDQRISLRYHLNPLSPTETMHYLVHRIRATGHTGKIPVSREAADLLAKHSRGIPREINRIAKLALDYAVSHEHRLIDSHSVQVVIDDLERQGGLFDPAASISGDL